MTDRFSASSCPVAGCRRLAPQTSILSYILADEVMQFRHRRVRAYHAEAKFSILSYNQSRDGMS
jgi:hypothetical protein